MNQGKLKGKTMILGDLNVNWNMMDRCPFKDELERLIDEHLLHQLIHFETRFRMVQGQTQSSILDLVITDVDGIQTTGVFSAASDHLILEVTGKERTEISKKRKQVTFLDWRWYAKDLMCQGFEANFKGINVHMTNIEMMNNRIVSAICKTLNILAPKRTVSLPNSTSVTSPLIQTLKNRKSRAYKKWGRTKNIEDFETLKRISQKLNLEIKKVKNNTIFNKCSKGPKQF